MIRKLWIVTLSAIFTVANACKLPFRMCLMLTTSTAAVFVDVLIEYSFLLSPCLLAGLLCRRGFQSLKVPDDPVRQCVNLPDVHAALGLGGRLQFNVSFREQKFRMTLSFIVPNSVFAVSGADLMTVWIAVFQASIWQTVGFIASM